MKPRVIRLGNAWCVLIGTMLVIFPTWKDASDFAVCYVSAGQPQITNNLRFPHFCTVDA